MQELAVAVEGHWGVVVRRVALLLVVVQEGAIWRLGDRAAMEVLVLQVQWEGRGAERLFDGLKVRSSWDAVVEFRRIVVRCESRSHGWIEVSRRRCGIAQVMWIDTALVSGTEAVVEVSQRGVVCLVSLCVVDIERTGEARVSKRRVRNLTGHLGKE